MSSPRINKAVKTLFSLLNLRNGSTLPPGRCVYVQSGDSTDFDGYLCAAIAQQFAKLTPDLVAAIVVPRRRATPDRTAKRNVHDDNFSGECMKVAYALIRGVAPDARIFEGPLNEENFIPNKFIAHERKKYARTLAMLGLGADAAFNGFEDKYEDLDALVALIDDDETTSVVFDNIGACGFFQPLMERSRTLLAKMKASGQPVCTMNGILAEEEIKTLSVPGRDRRATMNNLYANPASFMNAVQEAGIPLVYSTNTATTAAACYEDDDALVGALGLRGILAQMARDWYGGHLKGKYVPFDWITLLSRIAYGRDDNTIVVLEQRELRTGLKNKAVQVLLPPADAVLSDEQREHIQNALSDDTEQAGPLVASVKSVDSSVAEAFAKALFGASVTSM